MTGLHKGLAIVGAGAVLASGIYWFDVPNNSGTRSETESSTQTSGSGNWTTDIFPESDSDCTDFTTHAEAQVFFESQGPGDPHGLDRDGDGIACETLP